jgi:hypothetical protein
MVDCIKPVTLICHLHFRQLLLLQTASPFVVSASNVSFLKSYMQPPLPFRFFIFSMNLLSKD